MSHRLTLNNGDRLVHIRRHLINFEAEAKARQTAVKQNASALKRQTIKRQIKSHNPSQLRNSMLR